MNGYRNSAWVYYCDDGRGRIKIGYSLNPWKREAEFKTVNPELEMVVIETAGGRTLEQRRHIQFEKEHIGGEWFLKSDRLADWIDFLTTLSGIEFALEHHRRAKP